MNNDPIYVTMPSLAPLEEYTEILKGVWKRGILTHNGPLVQEFERELCKALGTSDFVAVANGTIAIQMAMKALGLGNGEIITTPFTWIATVSAIQWEGCEPVFCDIDPDTLNIDAQKIEDCITEHTVAIMPVHVFGNPCDVEAIQAIADRHGLKVIYDAAHAVGSTLEGTSLLSYGDISATSLHATKLLNTAEGGGCVATDEALQEKLKRIRFFGHDEKKEIVEQGFNGKMTEVHAALGLANLNYFEDVLQDRKQKYLLYKSLLGEVPGIRFQTLKAGEPNYSYFPVIFDTEQQLLEVIQRLANENIHARRYFYPSVNTFTKVVEYSACPIAENIAERILCLPLYWKLDNQSVSKISKIISA